MVFVKRDLGFAPAKSPRLICEIWEPFTGGIGEMPSLPVTVSNLIRQRNVK